MATATGFLQLDIKGFDSAVNSVKRTLKTLAVAFVSFKTAQWFKNGIQEAIEFGKEMHQASKSMGNFDPGQLLIAQKTLERMGLSAEEARNQMGELIHAGRPLSSLFKSSQDFADAMGKSRKDFGSQAAILSKYALGMNSLFYTLQSIGEKVKTFFLSMVSRFIEPLQAALNELNKIDLADMGKKFGDYIKDAIEVLTGALRNETLGQIISLALEIGFKKAVNFLDAGLQELGWKSENWFIDAFKAAGDYLKKSVESIFGADFFTIIGKRFKALGLMIGALQLDMWGQSKEASQARIMAAKEEAGAQYLWYKMGKPDDVRREKPTPEGPYKTDLLEDELRKLISEAKSIGQKVFKSGGPPDSDKGLREGLGKQDPYKVIADSLASVGGGGGFLRQGMSVAEKAAAEQAKAAREMLDQQKKTNQILERGLGGLGDDFKARGMTGMTQNKAGIKTNDNLRGMTGMSKDRQGLNMKR